MGVRSFLRAAVALGNQAREPVVRIPLSELHSMRERGFPELIPYTHKNPLVRWVFWQRLETMVALAGPLRTRRVLDFGAGSGVLTRDLSARFERVDSVDLHTDSLAWVKRRFGLENVSITTLDGSKLPFDDASFDAVFAADVLEHFEDRRPALREIRRVLKPGGLFIASGPTENFLYVVARRMLFWFWQKKLDHFTNIDGIIQESTELFRMERVIVLPFGLIPGFKIFRAVVA
jgi:SAM-dependent methyltransferase